MKYNIVEIIEKKIYNKKLKEDDGNIKDYQAASLITAIMINGLDIDETYFLTKAMINSGKKLNFKREILDKHSTGGVGDKVTIALIPILASLRIYST